MGIQKTRRLVFNLRVTIDLITVPPKAPAATVLIKMVKEAVA
jgi:hypothetical protein